MVKELRTRPSAKQLELAEKKLYAKPALIIKLHLIGGSGIAVSEFLGITIS